MQLKIKKLHKDAVKPEYAKDGDAGLDLTAVEMYSTPDYIGYKTGLAIEIPKGYVGLLFPRSSNSKKHLLLANSVGVVDSGYRGEIELRFKIASNTSENFLEIYKVGDKVAQLMILPYPSIEFEEVEELSDTARGEGGFGSSGK
jgi:dUTP pyrophosphatase